MNNFLQRLCLVRKFQFRTKLQRNEILARVNSLTEPFASDYYGYVWENGFRIYEKHRKHFFGGSTKNSFAPSVTAVIFEEDGVSLVSCTAHLHPLVMVLFVPIYLCAALTVVFFPAVHLLLHFAFFKPAKRLQENLLDLLER